jgi:hypothetical protein
MWQAPGPVQGRGRGFDPAGQSGRTDAWPVKDGPQAALRTLLALAVFPPRFLFHAVVGTILAARPFLLALLIRPLLTAWLVVLLRLRLRAMLLAVLIMLLVLLVGTLLLLVFTLLLLGHFQPPCT